MNGSDLIKKVSDNTVLFRTKMTSAGFNIIVSKLTARLKIKTPSILVHDKSNCGLFFGITG